MLVRSFQCEEAVCVSESVCVCVCVRIHEKVRSVDILYIRIRWQRIQSCWSAVVGQCGAQTESQYPGVSVLSPPIPATTYCMSVTHLRAPLSLAFYVSLSLSPTLSFIISLSFSLLSYSPILPVLSHHPCLRGHLSLNMVPYKTLLPPLFYLFISVSLSLPLSLFHFLLLHIPSEMTAQLKRCIIVPRTTPR